MYVVIPRSGAPKGVKQLTSEQVLQALKSNKTKHQRHEAEVQRPKRKCASKR